MAHDKDKEGAGMYLEDALNTIASDATHTKFAASGVSAQGVKGNLDALDKRLKDGEPVPFRIGYKDDKGNYDGGGHFMMLSDVRRGQDGGRQYLMSDPISGATRWVPEADLNSGAFSQKQFDLGKADITSLYGDENRSF